MIHHNYDELYPIGIITTNDIKGIIKRIAPYLRSGSDPVTLEAWEVSIIDESSLGRILGAGFEHLSKKVQKPGEKEWGFNYVTVENTAR